MDVEDVVETDRVDDEASNLHAVAVSSLTWVPHPKPTFLTIS